VGAKQPAREFQYIASRPTAASITEHRDGIHRLARPARVSSAHVQGVGVKLSADLTIASSGALAPSVSRRHRACASRSATPRSIRLAHGVMGPGRQRPGRALCAWDESGWGRWLPVIIITRSASVTWHLGRSRWHAVHVGPRKKTVDLARALGSLGGGPVNSDFGANVQTEPAAARHADAERASHDPSSTNAPWAASRRRRMKGLAARHPCAQRRDRHTSHDSRRMDAAGGGRRAGRGCRRVSALGATARASTAAVTRGSAAAAH
jgi:hypothetical protein